MNLGTRLLGSLLVIPNVMLLFTKRKQSLADILTHTVVVRYEQPAPPVTAADKLRAICVNLVLLAAIIGIGGATFGPFLMLMSENDNLIPIRNDLVSYTDLLETYFHTTRRPTRLRGTAGPGESASPCVAIARTRKQLTRPRLTIAET